MIIKGAQVFDNEFNLIDADLLIEGEKIAEVGNITVDDNDVLDMSGYIVAPGFIDIHIHGCAGSDTGDATPEAVEAISSYLVKQGVTSFCATSMTLSEDELKKIFLNAYENRNKVSGAYMHGINMEGPYIAPSKKGAQNGTYIRNPNKEEFVRLYESCGGFIKLVDIAPEQEGGLEFIKAVNPVCTVSIAHTSAGYEEAKSAFDAGLKHATHLFNAMSGLTHRAPGVVGAIFDSEDVRAEIICDGYHIHPAALRIAFKALGEDRSIVVSDAMKASGCPDGEYDLGGQPVYVRDGKAQLEDGTIAASVTNLHEEFKNLIEFGVPLRQAIKSCTINPAKAIREDDKVGSIEAGKRADIVIMDKDYNIKAVIVKGEIKVSN